MNINISYPKSARILSAEKLPILINGKIAGNLKRGESLTLPLEEASARIGIRGDNQSATTVQAGDRIEIKENSTYFILYDLSLAMIPIVLFSSLPTLVKMVLLTLSFLFTLGGRLLFPKYILYLQKSSDQSI